MSGGKGEVGDVALGDVGERVGDGSREDEAAGDGFGNAGGLSLLSAVIDFDLWVRHGLILDLTDVVIKRTDKVPRMN